MSNILVTGMTSAQTRENGTIAGYMAQTLRTMGHDVTVGKPSLRETLDGEKWDHVFVGLAPLHGLGSSSMYGALGVIGAHWPNDVTLYLDDIDSGKIGSGLRLFDRDHWRMTKPFYSYKREYSLATEPEIAEWLLRVVHAIVHSETVYPSVLVPAFSFKKAFEAAEAVSYGAAQHAKVVDFSELVELPDYINDMEPLTPEQVAAEIGISVDESYWSTQWDVSSHPVTRMGVLRWPVVQAPSSRLSYEFLRHSNGILIPTGAWHEAFPRAIAEGLPIATDWRSQAEIGESFEILPQDIEHLGLRDTGILIQSQRHEFENRPTRDAGRKALESELKEK